MKSVDELVIVIGSAQRSHDLDNPFTAGERIMMMRTALNEEGIDPSNYFLIPVPDAPMHSVWVAEIVSYSPPFEMVYSNDPLTRRLFKELNITVNHVKFFKRRIYSATEVRRRMLKGENWEELLTRGVVKIIREIDGVGRLRELAMTDSPFDIRKQV
jgi:nicotinamide-nucleotide adenylyltransferase